MRSPLVDLTARHKKSSTVNKTVIFCVKVMCLTQIKMPASSSLCVMAVMIKKFGEVALLQRERNLNDKPRTCCSQWSEEWSVLARCSLCINANL